MSLVCRMMMKMEKRKRQNNDSFIGRCVCEDNTKEKCDTG
jgi:hypothetical protein